MRVLLISMPDRHPYLGKREHEAPSLYRWYNGCRPQGRTKHLTSKPLIFEKWKARCEIIEDWRPNAQVKAHLPYFSMFYQPFVRPIIRFNEHRMDLMYGEVGRYKRQMMRWARMNDRFGDMVIDERFFDPNVEGPESIGNPAASLDYGRAPYADTCVDHTFVRTSEPGWHEPRVPLFTGA